jgi:dynein heavy chain
LVGSPLKHLGKLLSDVFLPLLQAPESATFRGIGGNQTLPDGLVAVGLNDAARSELSIATQKFSLQVHHTLMQVAGEARLSIPTDLVVDNVKEAARNPQLVETLSSIANEWIEVIVGTLNDELAKQPKGQGPLAEIDFWRERNASLSILYEQTNQPAFKTYLAVLTAAQTSNAPTLEYQVSEIAKLYVEANDNIKFLTTLERHFKNIVIGSLHSVAETLPSLMNAIRMVWIISRYYNRDERMVPLMSRIAWEIAHKVIQAINVKTVFRIPPAQAKQLLLDAKDLLETWSKCYFEVRERLEQSGRDRRWEFDRKKLFEQTNYMAMRCGDVRFFIYYFRSLIRSQ